jgi:hypothetical protein
MREKNMNEINNKCVDWLLSSSHPSIRYLTKTKLLKENPSPDDITALTAPGSPIAQMMDQLKDQSYWIADRHFYSPKYVASHWSLLILHEYACPADYAHIQKACLHILEKSQQKWLNGILEKQNNDHELSCFFGNLVRYAFAFGLGDHPDTQDTLAFLSKRKNGKEWCCIHNQNQPCLWGAIRTLYAYAIIPQEKRSRQIQVSTQSALDMVYNCAEMLTSETLSPSPKEHTLWEKLSFPLYYQSDKLFTLRILQELDELQNPKLQPVLTWLQSKRQKDGTWRGSCPYKSRSWPYGMDSETINQWTSLFSLSILLDAGLEKR